MFEGMRIPDFHHTIIYINVVLAVSANSLLIFMILFHTKQHMLTYSKLMLLFALFNIFYPILYVFIAPIIFMDGYGFIMFATGLLSKTEMSSRIGLIMYASAYSQSLTLLCFHFIYRYALICQDQWVSNVDARKLVVLLCFTYFAISAAYSLNVDVFLINDPVVKDNFADKMFTVFDSDIHQMSILGGLYFRTSSNGTTSPHSTTIVGTSICILFLFGTFGIIFYCGINIFVRLHRANMSDSTRKMQLDIFKALVVQTLVPAICEYIPSGITLLCPIFHISVDATFVTLFISVYSVLEPWVMIYFVKNYRYKFLQTIGLKSCAPKKRMAFRNNSETTVDIRTCKK